MCTEKKTSTVRAEVCGTSFPQGEELPSNGDAICYGGRFLTKLGWFDTA